MSIKKPMNKIEKLIDELCPEGVAFRVLGDCIQKNTGGGTPSKAVSSYWNGDIPWASVGDLSNEGIMIGTTRNFITQEGLQNSSSHLIPRNDVIVAVKISPGKMKIAGSDIAINQDLRGLSLKSFLNNKFLTYYFKTINVIGNGTIVKAITVSTLNRIQIPIPPLTIQKEIVKILDNFTQLGAELGAELEARKKQYEHYREALLSFDDGVEFRELGEVCDIGDGLHGTPQYSKTGNYYFINGNNLNNGRILFDSKTKKVDDSVYEKYGIPFSAEKTIFMSINGTIGSVAHFNNESIVLGKSVAYFNIKSKLIVTKYLSYFLRTHNAKEYYLRTATGATIKNLGLKSLRKFHIPIPPLAEQKRIVAILDKFDALVADISTGLPAEINARKKQYEYYRNQLLTFKPLEEQDAR